MRYLRPVEVQRLQARQSGQLLQTRARYLRVVEVQYLQARQSGQFLQPRVRYRRAAKAQPLQARQSGQFLQPRVRYLRAGKAQPLQALQSGQFLQPRVRYLRAAEGQQLQALQSGHRKPKSEKGQSDKLSCIDAAAKVLGETGKPMTCKELIETMAAKKLWTTPGGQTPWATLYAAILREIKVKGSESRFVKAERGKFALSRSV